jgi:hypothetical protein
MAVESVTHISDLNAAWPDGAVDGKNTLDNHIRGIKTGLKTDFPNINGVVSASDEELSYVTGVTSAIQTQLNAKAPLASPALTGTPTVPTAAPGTNTTQAASTAFVAAAAAVTAATQLSGDMVRLITTPTISGTPATVNLVNGSGGVVLDGTYNEYLICLLAFKPATDAVALYLRTSTDGGVSYASANAYAWTGLPSVGTAFSGLSQNWLQLTNSGDVGNATGEEGLFGWLRLYKPGAAAHFLIDWQLSYRRASDGAPLLVVGSGVRTSAADVDAIQLYFSSGNVASGDIFLYGRKV